MAFRGRCVAQRSRNTKSRRSRSSSTPAQMGTPTPAAGVGAGAGCRVTGRVRTGCGLGGETGDVGRPDDGARGGPDVGEGGPSLRQPATPLSGRPWTGGEAG